MRYILIAFLLFLASCAPKRVKAEWKVQESYTSFQTSDGQWIVISKDAQGEKEAEVKLGCKPCAIEDAGEIYLLERR